MDFRNRLLVGLLVLALGTAGWQLGLGYWSFKDSLDKDLQGDLAKYMTLTEAALDLEGPYPTLDSAKLPSISELQGRIRLSKEGQVLLEVGGPFPGINPDWLRHTRNLPTGQVLEVALSQRDHNLALRDYLRASMVSLLFSLVFAVLLAILLRRYLMRPLQSLESATESLAHAHFPEPLPVFGRDELARLTGSFNRMVGKLRRAMEREKSFTRYASHELRTPLAAVKANLGAARQGVVTSDELIEVVENNLTQMENTLNGLLALARGLGKPSPVQMSIFLEELVETLPEAAQKRVCINAPAITLELPREALAGAVRNLLENALKYSQDRVYLTLANSPLRLVARDFGPGVPQETLKRLTEPFFRVHPDLPGTGLGLTYARQVAEALGGSLELHNHPEGGFEATLLLEGSRH